MSRVVAVDVGGTFTDIVEFDGRQVLGRKVPTTMDQSDGVADAVLGSTEDVFLHGTTSATNALLEERGAVVSLVTDAGYEDLIEIARQDRPSLYDSSSDRPRPLVDRSRRHGHAGDIGELIRAIETDGSDIVAVGLIESYQDPEVELGVAESVREALGRPVITSSAVSPEFREYERIATTVLSAYLTPSVASYLESLDGRLPMGTRLVMTSSGGLLPFAQGPAAAGRLVLSGPAGGAVAAAALGRHHGYKTVLSFDMGGTSTDVCRITDGVLAVGSGHEVGGRVNRVPSVPIRTIGAGGGSIGWADPGGALRVGPHSAGAHPGPAAYGLGGQEATVTDANIVAGHIPPDLAMGGTVMLDLQASIGAVRPLGERVGLSVEETARGILEVVDANMEHALRSVSVEEGADPREAVLVAFGGAGGLHASRLARRLGMSTVLIPPLSGVFSALGLAMAAPRADVGRTVMLNEGDGRLRPLIRELEDSAAAGHSAIFHREPLAIGLTGDVRYRGQSHELEVPASGSWPELRAAFETAHRQMFGFTRRGEPVELVNLRAMATGTPPLSWGDLPPVSSDLEPVGSGGVWRRASLPPGFEVEGPAMVIETNSVVLLGQGDRMLVLDDGALEITL